MISLLTKTFAQAEARCYPNMEILPSVCTQTLYNAYPSYQLLFTMKTMTVFVSKSSGKDWGLRAVIFHSQLFQLEGAIM